MGTFTSISLPHPTHRNTKFSKCTKMSSWFSLETIADISNRIQESLPLDTEIKKTLVSGISKIALLSPDLVAEHDRIDSEERRKEKVRDSLANLLPFETRDECREILVEDCRERILCLSTHESSFTYPFEPPEGIHIFAPVQDEDGNEVLPDSVLIVQEREKAQGRLDKLQPLPKMLEDFDLDSHVGLIQRLLKLDKNLVVMQSRLSGAGEKEHLFWKNYFVNCAVSPCDFNHSFALLSFII